MLYREPKLLNKKENGVVDFEKLQVSVLYREPKLLKGWFYPATSRTAPVSVLYREPKLLKGRPLVAPRRTGSGFSALP